MPGSRALSQDQGCWGEGLEVPAAGDGAAPSCLATTSHR